MNKIENAVADGEDSIRQLEEKGVPQEIINEEKANLESNKKIIEKMQEDIKALYSEIRKIKATKAN